MVVVKAMKDQKVVDYKYLKSDNTVSLSVEILRASGFATGQRLRIEAAPGVVELHEEV